MKAHVPWSALVLPAWLGGLCAAGAIFFAAGPQLQCAADAACAGEATRWWHTPAIVAAALGPGMAASVVWWRSRRRAV